MSDKARVGPGVQPLPLVFPALGLRPKKPEASSQNKHHHPPTVVSNPISVSAMSDIDECPSPIHVSRKVTENKNKKKKKASLRPRSCARAHTARYVMCKELCKSLAEDDDQRSALCKALFSQIKEDEPRVRRLMRPDTPLPADKDAITVSDDEKTDPESEQQLPEATPSSPYSPVYSVPSPPYIPSLLPYPSFSDISNPFLS